MPKEYENGSPPSEDRRWGAVGAAADDDVGSSSSAISMRKPGNKNGIQQLFELTVPMRSNTDRWLQAMLQSDRDGQETWEMYCFVHGLPLRVHDRFHMASVDRAEATIEHNDCLLTTLLRHAVR